MSEKLDSILKRYHEVEHEISSLSAEKDRLHSQILELYKEEVGATFARAKKPIILSCHGYEYKSTNKVSIKEGAIFRLRNYPFSDETEIKVAYDEYFSVSLKDEENFEKVVFTSMDESGVDFSYVKDSSFEVI